MGRDVPKNSLNWRVCCLDRLRNHRRPSNRAARGGRSTHPTSPPASFLSGISEEPSRAVQMLFRSKLQQTAEEKLMEDRKSGTEDKESKTRDPERTMELAKTGPALSQLDEAAKSSREGSSRPEEGKSSNSPDFSAVPPRSIKCSVASLTPSSNSRDVMKTEIMNTQLRKFKSQQRPVSLYVPPDAPEKSASLSGFHNLRAKTPPSQTDDHKNFDFKAGVKADSSTKKFNVTAKRFEEAVAIRNASRNDTPKIRPLSVVSHTAFKRRESDDCSSSDAVLSLDTKVEIRNKGDRSSVGTSADSGTQQSEGSKRPAAVVPDFRLRSKGSSHQVDSGVPLRSEASSKIAEVGKKSGIGTASVGDAEARRRPSDTRTADSEHQDQEFKHSVATVADDQLRNKSSEKLTSKGSTENKTKRRSVAETSRLFGGSVSHASAAKERAAPAPDGALEANVSGATMKTTSKLITSANDVKQVRSSDASDVANTKPRRKYLDKEAMTSSAPLRSNARPETELDPATRTVSSKKSESDIKDDSKGRQNSVHALMLKFQQMEHM